MAKFEEADPRWKVQDMDVVILTAPTSKAGQTGELKCTKVDKSSGEASLSRRKGKKVMLLYELELNLKWEATIKNESGEVVSTSKGSFNMPCIDTVEAVDGFEIQVKFNKDTPEQDAANSFAKTAGTAKVRSIIVSIIEKLKSETSQSAAPAGSGSPAPASDSGTSAATQVLTTALKAAALETSHTTSKSHPAPVKADGTVQVSTEFNAPVREIFECFTVPQRLMAYTQSRAQVGTKPGDVLSLFDGSITGSVVECENGQKLVWKWRQSSWAEDAVSTCTITFTENGPGSTRVNVVQTGIPASDAHGNDDMVRVVEEGWKRNLLDRIKMVFGYGVPEFH